MRSSQSSISRVIRKRARTVSRARAPSRRRSSGSLDELDVPLRCLGDGFNQEAIDAILDLMRDATRYERRSPPRPSTSLR